MPHKKKTILTPLTEEITLPAKWLKNLKRKNARRTHKWTVNKEAIYDNTTKYLKRYDKDFNEERIQEGSKNHITNMAFHSMIMVLPDGKVITPIRQFCDLKLLSEKQNEAHFYNFDQLYPADSTNSKPHITQKEASLLKKDAERGTKILLGYPITADTVLDITTALNRSFSLECIHDENRAVLDICMNKQDMFGHWINDKGQQIVSDEYMKGNLSFKAINKAIQIISDEGLDTSNLILATSGKGLRDLTLDDDLDKMVDRYNENHSKYEQMERPAIISQGIIEKILGIKMFATNAISYGEVPVTRSILFMPKISFGLVSGKEVKLEGFKKLRPKVVHVTGIERVTALLKVPESVVRISHG